jgi:hypothetical protein
MKPYRKQGRWMHGLKPTVFKQLNQVKGKLYESGSGQPFNF